MQKQQGLKLVCLEKIAYHQAWIDAEHMEKLPKSISKNDYTYLLSSFEERFFL